MPRVLLVDDENLVTETLAPYLQARLHVEMSTARSGDEALQLFQRQPFDLVIADYAMPGMTGVQLLHTLRADNPECRRVIVTGHRDPLVREAAEVLGAVDAYLLKPYSLRRTVKVLRALLDHPRAAPRRRAR